MGSGSHYSLSSPGLAIACEFFPARSQEIQVLFGRDDSFRGLCEDLAAAEAVLLTVDGLPDGIRAARRFEYQDLISSLLAEIEEMLSLAKVIRMPRKPRT
jgi:hypothetical protein